MRRDNTGRALKVQHKFASSFWWSCESHVFDTIHLKS